MTATTPSVPISNTPLQGQNTMTQIETTPRYEARNGCVYDTTLAYRPLVIARFEAAGCGARQRGRPVSIDDAIAACTDNQKLAEASAAALNALVSS